MCIFLPVALGLYYLAPRRARNGALFLISLVFYAWGEPIYVILMIFSTLVDYSHGLLLEKCDHSPWKRKAILISSVAINLGLLGFFKYADFLVENINALFGLATRPLQLPLPIGISFYTFQTMSYTLDVYRRNCNVQHNLISFGCYVTMFPQLIAGPIVRYVTVEEQLKHRKETVEKFSNGVIRFGIGLCKKVLLANNIGMVWDGIKVLPLEGLSVLTAWMGILAFAFQIYFDFSGYSDMAIGLGKMFGFDFPENFNHPYSAKSITEFWRRWHISLSTWFREYVYIPLGGNRVPAWKNIRNLAIVWLLTGIWHGASWNFAIWGGYFAVLLILEKFVYGKALAKLPKFFGWLYAFVAVLISWVFFSFDALGDGWQYLMAMFGKGAGWADMRALYELDSNGTLLMILALCSSSLPKKGWEWLKERWPKAAPVIQVVLCFAGLLLSMAFVVDSSYNPFLYFRF